MSTDSGPGFDLRAQHVRTLQIINVAFLLGTLTFTGIVLGMPERKPAPGAPPSSPLITRVMLGGAGVMYIMSFILPGMMVKSQRQKIVNGTWTLPTKPEQLKTIDRPLTTEEKLSHVYMIQKIVSLALPEGAVFMSMVAYMVEHQWISLVVAGIGISLLAGRFTTAGAVDRWIEEQSIYLSHEKQFS